MKMGVCRSPALLCGLALLLGLAGRALGQAGHSISPVPNLTPAPVLDFGSDGDIFTCSVTVMCSGGTCTASTLAVTWFRDNNNLMGVSGYTIMGDAQNVLLTTNGSTTVLTSTLSITNAAATHLGQYHCSAVLNGDTATQMDSQPMDLTLKIPVPTATLASGGTAILGSPASLSCTVSLSNFNNYMSIVTVNVQLRKGSTEIETKVVSSMMSESMFTLNNVNASNAGQYQCRVSVTSSNSNVMTPAAFTSVSATLNVQFPQPTVSLSGATVVLGFNVDLTCTVTLVSFSSYSSVTPLTISAELLRGGMSIMTTTSLTGSDSTRTGVFTLTNVNAANAGIYLCRATVSGSNVINSNPGTSSPTPVTLSVQFPQPAVSLSVTSAVVGTNTDLTCTVTLENFSSYSSVTPLTISAELLRGGMSIMTTSSLTGSDSTRTGVFTLTNVNASNAGIYQCRATVSGSNVFTSNPGTSMNATLSIQLPQPTVSLSDASTRVGTSTDLICMVTLQKFDSYSSISLTVSVELSMGGTTVLMSNIPVTVAELSSSFPVSNAGMYQCRASVNSNEVHVTQSVFGIPDSATLYVVDSTVTANPDTVLNAFPYNDFMLTCNVNTNPDVTPTSIMYQWSGSNVTTMNSDTITVLNTNVDTTSYHCDATVSVNNNLSPVTVMGSTMVTVRGTAPPNVPTNVTSFPVSDGANINFTVTRVAYTPETYSVRYGLADSNLNLTSTIPVTSGGVDNVHSFISQTNVEYSIELTNLREVTTYYFQVIAMNMNNTVQTGIFNFTTNEAPPGPPSNPRITAINSTALSFSWGFPMRPNGNITGYNFTCVQTGTDSMMRSGNTSSVTISVVLTGLAVYTSYTCSVSASTLPGVGEPATIIGRTGEEAPETAPDNFTITQTTSTTLSLQWSPPLTPNGIVRMYRYVCVQVGMRGEGGSRSPLSVRRIDMMTPLTMTTVSRLHPFTNYTCSVNASTNAGEGPGASAIATTRDADPESVQNLNVSGVSDNVFLVNWSSPMIDNGDITNYTVLVTYYTNGSEINRTNVPSVSDDDDNPYSQTVTSQQLEKGVPYNVSVAASTSAGMGPADLVIRFTTEGTPEAVTGVDVTYLNDTAVTVSWTPLTLVQARGWLTGYNITLTPTEPPSQKRQAAEIVTANAEPSANSTEVGGLSSTQHYDVTVAGRTSAGTGEMSMVVVQTPLVSPGFNMTLIAIIVAVGVAVVLILVVIVVILIVCFLKTRRSTKLHTLTVKENEIALNIVDDNGSNGKGVELTAMETKTALDEDAIRRCEPVPMEEFPNHCSKLHFNRDLGFEEEYETFKNVPKGSFMVSKLPSNTPKNRFENVYSFDNSRVILPAIEGVTGSDYINASYMNGYNRDNAYIAAQGPLPQTVGDFWRMVWELKLPTVVMLTELIERGIEKCHCYWPKSINHTLDVGFGLKITLVEQKAFVEYKYKMIAVTNSNDPSSKPLKVAHYHFTAWPDHGVPADKTCMLAFIKRVRKTHPVDGPPLLVHCSAGVGRTGTFIVLDSNMQRMKAEGTLNIYQLITDMRTRRVLMVQTEAQYVYIHDALQEYIVCGDTSIPAEKIRQITLALQKVSDHKSGYQKQFELIEEVSIKPSDSYCTEALAKENLEKNRFPQQLETLPYNNTRVRFRTMTGIGGGAGGEGGGNYINASYVDGYKHRGAFLATQTPLKDTIEDFWHMLWETQSKAIVMLCNLEEEGKDPYPQYWPAKSGESETYGKMKVKLVSEKQDTEFVTRKLELSLDTDYINLAGGGDDQFVVTQFHYTKWPEQGKPSTPAGMLKLMEALLKTQQAAGNKSITVVCSDGVGRTGAFACIYSQLERVKTEAMADFFQYIKGSRFQRPGLVQTLDQYIFCHEVVCEFLSSFDNYHNFQGADQ